MSDDEATKERAMAHIAEFYDRTDTFVRVWPFHEAPEALRALSTHGGDEDYLAIVPPGCDDYHGWIDSQQFGCAGVDECPVGEWMIRIGAHA